MIIRLHIRVSRGCLRLGLASLLMAGPAGELCSEPVTMTSYYPAPSGAYSQIVVTQNSFFARDSIPAASGGGTSMLAVGSGNSVVPAGNTTKMAVMGNVGVGTLDPVFNNIVPGTSVPVKLQVAGSGGASVDAIIDGTLITGDNNLHGGVWFNTNVGGNAQFVGENSASAVPALGFYNGNKWGLTVTNAGNVGFNKSSPVATVDVAGTLVVRGRSPTVCDNNNEKAYTGGNNDLVCPAGTYVTWAAGVYTQNQTGTNTVYLSGHAFCCILPAGVQIW